MSSVAQASTDKVMEAVEACLIDPVLHPDHPGHDTPAKQDDFRKLRSALLDLYGPRANDLETKWVPLCGTEPADIAFRDAVCEQLRRLKNLFDMWDPSSATDLSARHEAFEEDSLPLLNDLLDADKLKMMVGGGRKPYRRHDLLSRLRPVGNGMYMEEPATKKKTFTVHYRSSHPHLTPQLVHQAYESWLSLLHAEVQVFDERDKPAAAEKEPESTPEEDHVYVVDAKLKPKVGAKTQLPHPNRKTTTIEIAKYDDGKDMFSWYAEHNNALGCLRHEVGHTLGFVHEDLTQLGAAVDRKVGHFPVAEHAGWDPNGDAESVMLPTKVTKDTHSNKTTVLSKRDEYGCRNFFGASLKENDPASTIGSPAFQGLGLPHQEALIQAFPCPCLFEDLSSAPSPSPLLDDWKCRACGLLAHYHRRAATQHGDSSDSNPQVS